MTAEKVFKVLSPTAILGYGFPKDSFDRGMAESPDLIAVDGGSTDPGPHYLGCGKSFTDKEGVKRDLSIMIRAGLTAKIPVAVGTSGGSGAAPHLAWCAGIVREIARENNLTLKLGLVPGDIPKETLKKALAENRITPLDHKEPLTPDIIESASHIVAQMGIEPFMAAHDQECDVILAGRAYDPAPFAALAVIKGFDKGLALHMGKILECAAIAATPGSGSDCALGILEPNAFVLKPLNPERKFTRMSVAAHSLYEKSDPYHLHGPGGSLDLTQSRFEELDQGMVRVSGTRFESSEKETVKLEGATLAGFRTVSVAGIRDPLLIDSIDPVLAAVKHQVESFFPDMELDNRIHVSLYGARGVMGNLEPLQTKAHELGLLIEALGDTQEQADTLCSLFRSTLLHYGYEGRVATAGNLAFPFSPSDIPAGQVFRFSIYHLMETAGENLFPLACEMIQGGGQ
ncbi:acyclic terpene utilization AtuA family protein [Desulfospira joergensenii]|uniref:acyclic terpene utilization AtuA family protein n=1 Tax=Desulfospira joergensenii TaxID=53329 RepID=UPI0003B3B5E6|nr:acyclic terpene utilization AtuA family protein [Desulfospira joergensenii]